MAAGDLHTRYVEEHIAELLGRRGATGAALLRRRGRPRGARAGAKVDAVDPLAVLAHGKAGGAPAQSTSAAPARGRRPAGPEGTLAAARAAAGHVVSYRRQPGDAVRAGQPVVVMEAMKMEHVIAAPGPGVVREFTVAAGDTVFEGHAARRSSSRPRSSRRIVGREAASTSTTSAPTWPRSSSATP